jgi:LmbE family N-acetylglucosaminyl deacetylase
MPTALMVGAHNEECEYNCGGLACKLARLGWRVVFLNLIGDYSNWPMWPEGMADGQERIDRDAVEAARRLGAEKILLDCKGHHLDGHDPACLTRIAEVINDLRPELMATHWPQDTNHDHREVARASFSAAQTTALLPGRAGYVVPEIIAHESYLYQSYHFTPDFTVRIDDCLDALSHAFAAFETYPAIVEEFERIKPIQTRARAVHVWPGGHAEAYAFLKFGRRLSVLPEVLGEDFCASGFARGTGLFGGSD